MAPEAPSEDSKRDGDPTARNRLQRSDSLILRAPRAIKDFISSSTGWNEIEPRLVGKPGSIASNDGPRSTDLQFAADDIISKVVIPATDIATLAMLNHSKESINSLQQFSTLSQGDSQSKGEDNEFKKKKSYWSELRSRNEATVGTSEIGWPSFPFVPSKITHCKAHASSTPHTLPAFVGAKTDDYVALIPPKFVDESRPGSELATPGKGSEAFLRPFAVKPHPKADSHLPLKLGRPPRMTSADVRPFYSEAATSKFSGLAVARKVAAGNFETVLDKEKNSTHPKVDRLLAHPSKAASSSTTAPSTRALREDDSPPPKDLSSIGTYKIGNLILGPRVPPANLDVAAAPALKNLQAKPVATPECVERTSAQWTAKPARQGSAAGTRSSRRLAAVAPAPLNDPVARPVAKEHVAGKPAAKELESSRSKSIPTPAAAAVSVPAPAPTPELRADGDTQATTTSKRVASSRVFSRSYTPRDLAFGPAIISGSTDALKLKESRSSLPETARFAPELDQNKTFKITGVVKAAPPRQAFVRTGASGSALFGHTVIPATTYSVVLPARDAISVKCNSSEPQGDDEDWDDDAILNPFQDDDEEFDAAFQLAREETTEQDKALARSAALAQAQATLDPETRANTGINTHGVKQFHRLFRPRKVAQAMFARGQCGPVLARTKVVHLEGLEDVALVLRRKPNPYKPLKSALANPFLFFEPVPEQSTFLDLVSHAVTSAAEYLGLKRRRSDNDEDSDCDEEEPDLKRIRTMEDRPKKQVRILAGREVRVIPTIDAARAKDVIVDCKKISDLTAQLKYLFQQKRRMQEARMAAEMTRAGQDLLEEENTKEEGTKGKTKDGVPA